MFPSPAPHSIIGGITGSVVMAYWPMVSTAKVHSRRHPGRFPAAAARAFQRQAPVSSPPVSLATPACSAASCVAAIVCGLFLLPVSWLPVSAPQHRQDLYHFGSLCGIRITSRARAGP